MSIGPNPESRRLLERAVDKSKRYRGLQLPIGFARSDHYETDPPPLARMMRGGRGGEVRLKLYLCLGLIATSQPFDIRPVPARVWASMLALDDPEGNGARRIADSLNWLADNRFISIDRQPGGPPGLTMLSPLGDGRRYSRPRHQWITVPVDVWRQEWILALSGRATALLVVLLDLQGGRTDKTDPPWLTSEQRQRYALSADTWTRATKELKEHGLLIVKRIPQGRDFDWRRLRNAYWIDLDRLEQGPTNPAERGERDPTA